MASWGQDGEPVALKVLNLGALCKSERAMAKALTEVAALRTIPTHEYVVELHSLTCAPDELAMIVDTCDDDLLSLLEVHGGRLSENEAKALFRQAVDAVSHLHAHSWAHRDIKPENMLLDRRGRLKIADFGLAKLLGRASPDSALTGPGYVIGTPHYMAPEQMERPLEVDHRADIYSLGAVLYCLVAGRPPFLPGSVSSLLDAARSGRFEPLAECAPHVAPAIAPP